MVEPRSEEAAEAGLLVITMGGRRYRLPALTLEQGEAWQARVAAGVAAMRVDLPAGAPDGGESALRDLLSQGSVERRRALAAYDVTGVLGGEEAIRRQMTARELHDAVETILDAEYPFDPDGRHSVAEAFGLPLRVLGAASQAAMDVLSRPASSLSGLWPTGASAGPTSVDAGPASSSSSDGPTVSGGPAARSRTARSRRSSP